MNFYLLATDTIPMITDHRNYSRHRLQEQLINAKCFTSIMSSMATITDTSSKRRNEVVVFPMIAFLIVMFEYKYNTCFHRRIKCLNNCVAAVLEL